MTIFARVDSWIQSAVDFVMFAIMRATGWGRAAIRYRIAMGPQLSAGVVVCAAFASEGLRTATVIWFLFGVIFETVLRGFDRKIDVDLERRGLAREARPCRVSGVLMVAEFAPLCAFGFCRVLTGSLAIWSALDAFGAYAAATPSVPPPLRMTKLATSEGT